MNILIDKIEQVVRLIRSKGVGIYFVSQSPLLVGPLVRIANVWELRFDDSFEVRKRRIPLETAQPLGHAAASNERLRIQEDPLTNGWTARRDESW